MKWSVRMLVVIAASIGVAASTPEASAQEIKPPIRGLVSMGAYRFVGYGGDPVNTLQPLDAKPGIFGGLVVICLLYTSPSPRDS